MVVVEAQGYGETFRKGMALLMVAGIAIMSLVVVVWATPSVQAPVVLHPVLVARPVLAFHLPAPIAPRRVAAAISQSAPPRQPAMAITKHPLALDPTTPTAAPPALRAHVEIEPELFVV